MAAIHLLDHMFPQRRLKVGRGLLACALLLFAAQVSAQIAENISWAAPTAYSDGTALPASDIWFYTLEWHGATAEPWMPFNSEQFDPSVLSTTVSLYCGSYSFTISVTTTLTATEPFATSAPAGPIVVDTGIPCPMDTTNMNSFVVQ